MVIKTHMNVRGGDAFFEKTLIAQKLGKLNPKLFSSFWFSV